MSYKDFSILAENNVENNFYLFSKKRELKLTENLSRRPRRWKCKAITFILNSTHISQKLCRASRRQQISIRFDSLIMQITKLPMFKLAREGWKFPSEEEWKIGVVNYENQCWKMCQNYLAFSSIRFALERFSLSPLRWFFCIRWLYKFLRCEINNKEYSDLFKFKLNICRDFWDFWDFRDFSQCFEMCTLFQICLNLVKSMNSASVVLCG